METYISYDVGAMQRRGGAKAAKHLAIYHIVQLVERFERTDDTSFTLVFYFLLGLLDEFILLMSTKLFAPALALFKETSRVLKQSQAQHEMLNMLKSRLFL
ncbi:hypothetical protein MKX03_001625 [Papaver bracteatum]|nr:hypothetical protein MKX03_001625 [Papaver bracteatum]